MVKVWYKIWYKVWHQRFLAQALECAPRTFLDATHWSHRRHAATHGQFLSSRQDRHILDHRTVGEVQGWEVVGLDCGGTGSYQGIAGQYHCEEAYHTLEGRLVGCVQQRPFGCFGEALASPSCNDFEKIEALRR